MNQEAQPPGGNVVPIRQQAAKDSHLEIRQEAIRKVCLEAAMRPPETAAIAGICISMKPDGTMRAVATCVEPDQVNAFLRSMDDMRKKLEAHRDDSRFQAAVFAIKGNGCALALLATAVFCIAFVDATMWPSLANTCSTPP